MAAILFASGIYLKKAYCLTLELPSLGYTSPLVVAASIGCFVFFARMEIRNERLCRLLRFAAPLTFAVYLIHEHPLLGFVTRDFAQMMARYDHYALWHTPLTALLIYLFCSLVDWCRRLGMKVCSAWWHRRKAET